MPALAIANGPGLTGAPAGLHRPAAAAQPSPSGTPASQQQQQQTQQQQQQMAPPPNLTRTKTVRVKPQVSKLDLVGGQPLVANDQPTTAPTPSPSAVQCKPKFPTVNHGSKNAALPPQRDQQDFVLPNKNNNRYVNEDPNIEYKRNFPTGKPAFLYQGFPVMKFGYDKFCCLRLTDENELEAVIGDFTCDPPGSGKWEPRAKHVVLEIRSNCCA
ncbi:hypothetical protein RvY_18736 [Ramazzottius varieornatus]|uniref:Uncharacterized protein n=1 Tax=Ramazzottius varieornatus TaxID=947166 RepID=A0A1D1W6V3_RAMVA|nr:hypothetical protein RvY_18736 [Ramazzottius varieornatus]